LKKVKILELLNLLKDNKFSIEIYKNKIKIIEIEKRKTNEVLEDTMSNLMNLDYRIIKIGNKFRVVILLREKFDPNMRNNHVLKDVELFPFLTLVPQEYSLYAENYQAEISV